MTDHEHRPDYACFHSRRRPRELTCTHCGKPIHCTNSYLSWFSFLPIPPALVAFNSHNRIVMILSVAAVGFLIPLLKRSIFPHLRFEIDYEAMRSGLKHRRF